MDLVLINLQRLICHKPQQTKPNFLFFSFPSFSLSPFSLQLFFSSLFIPALSFILYPLSFPFSPILYLFLDMWYEISRG